MEREHMLTAKHALKHLMKFYDEQLDKSKRSLEQWPDDADYWNESLQYWSERKARAEESYQAFRAI